MSIVTKYGGVFLLIASIVVVLAVLIDAFTGIGVRSLASAYCTAGGFIYEERVLNGVVQGYCVFSESNCSLESSCEPGINCIDNLGAINAMSECSALEFYNGTCKPCDYFVSDCSAFSGVRYCSQDFSPVCARVRIGVNAPYSFEVRQWGNACSACFNSKDTEFVTWFTNRTC